MTSREAPDEGAQLALAAEVARRHYLRDESKSDIGTSLDISRFKVARLLTVAREAGLVRIEVLDPAPPTEDALAAEVAERYGLRGCYVVPASGSTRDAVARRAARLLEQLVTDTDVLGLPWSRTVSSMVHAAPTLPAVPVVQLCGSLVITGEDSPVDVVRAAGRLTGSDAHVFYAPLIADNRESAQAILRQPSVADAMAAADDVTLAVVSVGAWAAGESTVHDFVSPTTRAEVAAAGAVGEVLGVLFDTDGGLVDTDLTHRMIGVSGPQLRDVKSVVALAHGPGKAAATAALLRGGLAGSLVTDTVLATELVSL